VDNYPFHKIVMFALAVATSSYSFAYTAANGEILRDPTQPYSAQPAPTRAATSGEIPLTLNYLKHSGVEKVAYINGRSLREGDQINGMQVAEITSSGVKLTRDGRVRWVKLHTRRGIMKKVNN